MRLQGKVAIVTGAASGNGRGIALRFAQEGAQVVATDLNLEGVQATISLIRAQGGEAVAVRTNVSLAADSQKMVQIASERFGRLDILVNNAGISPSGRVTDISEEEWDLCLNIDLKSVFLGCKYAIPVMIESGGGAIVNIAGTLGMMAMPAKAAYCAAKAGVINLTRQIAIDYGPQNIRANCVNPGFVDTPLNAGVPEAARRRIFARLPLPRAGQVEEIAGAALYLASDEARYVTGSSIFVDGGQTARVL